MTTNEMKSESGIACDLCHREMVEFMHFWGCDHCRNAVAKPDPAPPSNLTGDVQPAAKSESSREDESWDAATVADLVKSLTPKIVCLCGSSKHPDLHMRVMMEETLKGHIVIPMGLYGHADFPPGAKAATADSDESSQVKQMLDKMHFHKIDLADEIVVVRVDGYIGSSTSREIAYATERGREVRFYDVASDSPALDTIEALRAERDEARAQRDNGNRAIERLTDENVRMARVVDAAKEFRKIDMKCDEVIAKGEMNADKHFMSLDATRQLLCKAIDDFNAQPHQEDK